MLSAEKMAAELFGSAPLSGSQGSGLRPQWPQDHILIVWISVDVPVVRKLMCKIMRCIAKHTCRKMKPKPSMLCRFLQLPHSSSARESLQEIQGKSLPMGTLDRSLEHCITHKEQTGHQSANLVIQGLILMPLTMDINHLIVSSCGTIQDLEAMQLVPHFFLYK